MIPTWIAVTVLRNEEDLRLPEACVEGALDQMEAMIRRERPGTGELGPFNKDASQDPGFALVEPRFTALHFCSGANPLTDQQQRARTQRRQRKLLGRGHGIRARFNQNQVKASAQFLEQSGDRASRNRVVRRIIWVGSHPGNQSRFGAARRRVSPLLCQDQIGGIGLGRCFLGATISQTDNSNCSFLRRPKRQGQLLGVAQHWRPHGSGREQDRTSIGQHLGDIQNVPGSFHSSLCPSRHQWSHGQFERVHEPGSWIVNFIIMPHPSPARMKSSVVRNLHAQLTSRCNEIARGDEPRPGN